jgi:signal transduction histidine kinase
VGRRSDGQQFPLEASLSRLDTDSGVLTTVVLRDVTALHIAQAERRAREALEAANGAKTQFLSRMSHELRTPLNAVIGFTQLMRMDAAQPLTRQQLERAQHIESAGTHLLALVNDVLDMSRIESGEMTVSEEAILLPAAAEEAMTMISPLVTEAGVEVFVLPPRLTPGASLQDRRPEGQTGARIDDVWVKADRVRLRQVFVNLLSNAVKYNRPGGSVSLSWKTSRDVCEISITDTGSGIAPHKLDQLFEPFNRLGAETSNVQGTGIGLVLSRNLSKMMGGTLDIRSALGKGTTAILTLKISPPPQVSALVPTPSRQWNLPGHGSLSVLYAEDNEVNALLVRQIVAMRPAVRLRVAESGAEALEQAEIEPPDLMLVDMNLGDMTGAELAHQLRRNRATKSIPLVALSADALPSQIEAAMRSGFEAYLTKPVNLEALLNLLDKHLTVLAGQ